MHNITQYASNIIVSPVTGAWVMFLEAIDVFCSESRPMSLRYSEKLTSIAIYSHFEVLVPALASWSEARLSNCNVYMYVLDGITRAVAKAKAPDCL